MSKPLVISIHNYKTAGVTFYSIIDRQFKKDEILNTDLLGLESALSIITQSKPEKIKIVHGHFYFGIDKHFARQHTYITFLRNPIERVISDYYYCRSNPLAHNYIYASKLSFKEYLQCDQVLNIDNGQTRFISGETNMPYGSDSVEILGKAISNLEHKFSLVGITEKFDESLLIANQIFSWSQYYYASKNITSCKSHDFDEETWELLKKRNALDLQLYDYALKRHTKDFGKIPFAGVKMFFLKVLKKIYTVTQPTYSSSKKFFIRKDK
ncbi:sulfotransferase family 2 domain-containing protein [Flavobacterium sp.]|uniref:sulfotransferase family 2 domain-containing protein n=1 Tax=Flavobacterium sp. TaxID=239 RepID=UPI0025C16BBA|nr:sulfotransferase family 2 domain-containing protein [Flavobacterium sp.]